MAPLIGNGAAANGLHFPSLLQPRRRTERALVAIVPEAYVHGVSTRKVDDLVRSLGLEGISKSEVSRLCAELDGQVSQFRNRPLEGAYCGGSHCLNYSGSH